MVDVEIGELVILTSKQLADLKKNKPLMTSVIDKAVVKEIYEGAFLLEKSRLNFDINYGQNE